MISMSKSLKPGYSFIELTFGVLIMAVLAGFLVPKMMSLLGKSKVNSTKNTLKVVSAAIDQYKGEVGTYPEDIKDLAVKPAEGAANWDGPYVGTPADPTIPHDAWDQPLKYERMPRGTQPPYKLSSLGDPDKDEPIYAK